MDNAGPASGLCAVVKNEYVMSLDTGDSAKPLLNPSVEANILITSLQSWFVIVSHTWCTFDLQNSCPITAGSIKQAMMCSLITESILTQKTWHGNLGSQKGRRFQRDQRNTWWALGKYHTRMVDSSVSIYISNSSMVWATDLTSGQQ